MRHFITGAGSGIGAAIATTLRDRGDELTILARSRERAHQLALAFPGASFVVADLSQPVSVERALALASLPLALHSLLHIAGVARMRSTLDLSASDALAQLNVNLVSPMVLTRALLPALRATGGHVVFANSTAGLSAKPNWGEYSASKFGLRAYADSLRAEEQRHGVRVTSLFLGRTATPMQEQVHAQEGRPYDAARWIRPATVAEAVVGLLDLPRDAGIPDLWLRPNGAGVSDPAVPVPDEVGGRTLHL